jgi:hypothetical protein
MTAARSAKQEEQGALRSMMGDGKSAESVALPRSCISSMKIAAPVLRSL